MSCNEKHQHMHIPGLQKESDSEHDISEISVFHIATHSDIIDVNPQWTIN